mmetsp:Transcript_5908/g.8874  ORF Transcript_5908/g.8874 Transcript_5908/m.8874 type:complete len:186 (+) Transcript_5908:58-615(+)
MTQSTSMDRLCSTHSKATTKTLSSLKGKKFVSFFRTSGEKNLLEILDLNPKKLENEVFENFLKQTKDRFEELCFEKGISKKLESLDEIMEQIKMEEERISKEENDGKDDIDVKFAIVSAKDVSRAMSMEFKGKELERLEKQLEEADKVAADEVKDCLEIWKEVHNSYAAAMNCASEVKSARSLLP